MGWRQLFEEVLSLAEKFAFLASLNPDAKVVKIFIFFKQL